METELAIYQWLEALAAEGRSPETLKNYRIHLRPLPTLMPSLADRTQLTLRRW